MSIINTANNTLTGAARNGAAMALKAGRGASSGLLTKAMGLAATGLKAFANFTPWGKAATLAVGALGVSSLLGGNNSHPAANRVA